MSPDEFEKRLLRQPVRQIPHEWREGILAAATGECDGKVGSMPPSTRKATARWRDLFWPSPLAWAGLGCAWLLILGLHLAARPVPSPPAASVAPSSPELALALAEQRRLLAELETLLPDQVENRTHGLLRPRSERLTRIRGA